MPSNKIACLNPEAHHTQTHIAGSAAAIACQQTNGRSTKMAHIVVPPRQVHKGNNIGNVSVLTNISEEALEFSKANIKRETPRNVASLIEVASTSSALREQFKDFTRPFVNLVHDEDYADAYGENALLPNPHDVGFTYTEPNDQTQKIIDAQKAPGFNGFVQALATEMDTDFDQAASAYKVIAGYLGDEDIAKVYAVGCLRSEYLDRKDEVAEINKGIKELEALFNEEVDDGTKVGKHGIGFADGDGVQFTPARQFNYDDAAPLPLDDLEGDERAEAVEYNKNRLSQDAYKSIIKSWEPKYEPLAKIEKTLEKEDFDKFVTFGSTKLTVK